MKILFIHNSPSPFVKIDYEILRSQFNVKIFGFANQLKVVSLITDHFRVTPSILWADLIFVWFGSYFALYPLALGRLLRKKGVVVCSGYDVASIPEINYGNMRPGIRRWIGKAVFHLADIILPVSKYSAGMATKNTGVSPKKMRLIYHGLDANEYNFDTNEEIIRERKGVVTIAVVYDETVPMLKGLNTFVKAAAELPNIPFSIIGPWQNKVLEDLSRNAPDNVRFIGPRYGEELKNALTNARVYAQLSATESFGFGLAEAMLCGCVPVVTDRGALPEIVGDIGYIVSYGDVSATIEAIQQAYCSGLQEHIGARNHIVDCFSLDQRKSKIIEAIQQL